MSVDLPFDSPHGIRIHVFPPDAGLAGDVRDAWAEVLASGVPEDRLAMTLQQRLRDWYPRLTVQPRQDVASFGPFDQLWYVYRDGLVSRRPDIIDRMYIALHDARRMEADARAVMDRATETLDRATEAKTTRSEGRPPPGPRAGEDAGR